MFRAEPTNTTLRVFAQDGMVVSDTMDVLLKKLNPNCRPSTFSANRSLIPTGKR